MENKINICLFILGFHNGGVEKVLENYFFHMNRQGFDLHIVTHIDPDPARQKKFTDMGFKVHQLTRVCGHRITWQNIREYDELFRKYNFDIVHNNFPNNLLPLLMAKKYKIPVRILHSHNDYIASFYNKNIMIKKIYTLGLRVNAMCATHYLACGERAAVTAFGERSMKKKSIQILRNAITPALFRYDEQCRSEMREQLGLGDEFTVGHVGRYEDQQKNQEFVIQTFHKLLYQEPKAKLLMLGEGSRRPEIMRQVEMLGISQNVIFTGAVDNVQNYLQAMDIFVFPSRFEGLGLAMVEAQAAGLPCIASTNVPKEAKVTEHVSFLKAESKEDARTWAQEIMRLKEIVVRADQFKAIVEAGYDIEVEAARLENLYRMAFRKSLRVKKAFQI